MICVCNLFLNVEFNNLFIYKEGHFQLIRVSDKHVRKSHAFVLVQVITIYIHACKRCQVMS